MDSTKNNKPLTRQLILPQKQAYQGARSFYTCFLPLVIVVINIINILYCGFVFYNVSVSVINVITYMISLKLYQLCNIINVDAYVDSQYNNNNNVCIQQQPLQSRICSNKNQQQQQSLTGGPQNVQTSTLDQQNTIQERPTKFQCKKCQIECRYRSRHCPKCQVCVFRYDHHCFWIGNCVGYANHRQFYCFLFMQTINNMGTFQAFGILIDSVQQGQLWVIVLLYLFKIGAFGFIIFTGYLLLYHTMLMLSGMTTWQHMSRSRITYLNYLPTGYNPFSKGILTNIKQFWIHRQIWQVSYTIPTYQQSKTIDPGCNIIENKYYSCC